MGRSWPRYVFVTPQETGYILPCQALLPPRVFSSKLAREFSAGCSNGYLIQYVCECGACVLKVHNVIIVIYRFDKPPSLLRDHPKLSCAGYSHSQHHHPV